MKLAVAISLLLSLSACSNEKGTAGDPVPAPLASGGDAAAVPLEPPAPTAKPSAPPVNALSAAQRVDAWKKAHADRKVVSQKAVAGFVYAAAAQPDGSEMVAILATDSGEIEGPFTSGMNDPSTPAEFMEVGDLDGDGRDDLVLTYSEDTVSKTVVYLDKPAGPAEAWVRDQTIELARATHQGKPAFSLVIVDTAGDERGEFHNDSIIVYWDGSDIAEVPSPKAQAGR